MIKQEQLTQLLGEIKEIKETISQTKNQHFEGERWLDIPTVCRELKISTRLLSSWRSEGVLPYTQHSHKIWFKASDIAAFMESNYKESFRKNKG